MRLNVATVSKDDKSTRMLLLGKVVSVKDGTGAAEGRVLNVTIEGKAWDPDKKEEVDKKVQIGFWNNENGSQMRDRAIAAKIAEGVVIMVDASNVGDNYYANQFYYKGAYTIPETAETKEKNIFMGAVCNFQDNEKYVSVSIPVEDRNKEVSWKTIRFWPPYEEGQVDMAERARKCLKPNGDKKPRAVLICSEAKPYVSTTTGEERCSYNGYDIILY